MLSLTDTDFEEGQVASISDMELETIRAQLAALPPFDYSHPGVTREFAEKLDDLIGEPTCRTGSSEKFSCQFTEGTPRASVFNTSVQNHTTETEVQRSPDVSLLAVDTLGLLGITFPGIPWVDTNRVMSIQSASDQKPAFVSWLVRVELVHAGIRIHGAHASLSYTPEGVLKSLLIE